MINFLWVMGAFFGWIFIGIIVLSGIDDDEQQLFKWASSSPGGWFYIPVLILWPLITWNWYKNGNGGAK